MRSLRILIVTHAPLSPEFGAAQMAINLAEAFREQGHDVTLWSPEPIPKPTNWWQKIIPGWHFQQMRIKLEAFVNTQQPFDMIDLPGGIGLISKKVSKSAPVVVARSVQPQILYTMHSLNYPKSIHLKEIVISFINYCHLPFLIFFSIQDWRRATYILCLGSLELQWMKKWFPWWNNKLNYYLNALSKTDQETLSRIRLHRQKPSESNLKFIWIGRWTPHKGTNELLKFISNFYNLYPQYSFTIAGCGLDAEKYISGELLQSGKVTIIPSYSRNQLYSLLAEHDIGLFTSKVEGWGLALNEMLESGMTVLATKAGGASDLQPFFKEMLRPFPPPLQPITNIFIRHQTMENYYKIFTWEKIAETYINSMFADFKEADEESYYTRKLAR
jgi:glycosyltransferase involved in cell wall biosynthesis